MEKVAKHAFRVSNIINALGAEPTLGTTQITTNVKVNRVISAYLSANSASTRANKVNTFSMHSLEASALHSIKACIAQNANKLSISNKDISSINTNHELSNIVVNSVNSNLSTAKQTR